MGIVGNLDTEAENIFGNGLTVQSHCIGHTACCICHITEYRCFAVIDCVGIVNSDIVNIHNITTVVGFMLVVIIVICSTVTVRNIELNNIALKKVQSLIGTEVN